MSEIKDSKPGNVIQFPGSKKKDAPAPPAPPPKKRGSTKNMAATVLAVVVASIAVNRYVFEHQPAAMEQASLSRGLASVGALQWERDAQWEKDLAEKLASPKARTLASTHIGRTATLEEQLRWGTLEEKYTIAYEPQQNRIQSILLQDQSVAPSYVLDRDSFLNQYGLLFADGFASAKLKSVEKSDDKTVEAYTIFNKDHQPKGEARFELDRQKRLISLKVEPIQI